MSEEPLVSAEEVEKVLDAGGEEPQEEEQGPADGDSYSLRRPVPFVSESFERARRRFDELTSELGRSLAAALRVDVTAQAKGFQQRQVGEALDRVEAPAWVVAVGAEGRAGIALVFDAVNALALVELTMGGSGTYSAAGRTPTALEHRLMTSVAVSLRRELDRRLGVGMDTALFRVGRVPRRLLAAERMAGTGRVTFEINGAERTAVLLISPELLRVEREDDEDAGEEDTLGPLAQELTAVRPAVRPMLIGGRVRLRRLYELKPGALLMLTTPEGAPLRLCVNELPLFEGEIHRDDRGARFQLPAIEPVTEADDGD